MREGLKCVVCGKDATKYWFGGQALCDEHFNEWTEKEKRLREKMWNEFIEESNEKIEEERVVVKEKKKEKAQSRLF